MATIKDVARMAGVSTATVSRVINNHPSVTGQTRKLVHKAMDELCYLPSKSAIQLNGKKSGLLGALVPNLSNPHFDELILALEEESRYYGMNLLIKTHQNDPRVEKSAIQAFISLGVEGLFWVPTAQEATMSDRLKRSAIETIVITQRSKFFNSVLVDYRQGASLAATHLFELGYADIGFIGQQSVDSEKFSVFSRDLQQKGVTLEQDNVFWVTKGTGESVLEHTGDIRRIASEILEKKPKNLALWVYNDVVAASLMKILTEAGVAIPEQVALVSFDDTYLAHLLNISSVTQPIREIGRLAFNMVREDTCKDEIRCIELAPRLIARSSTLKVREHRISSEI